MVNTTAVVHSGLAFKISLGDASATLTVRLHPTLAKAFAPSLVAPNAASVLTITLTNPNATAVTGAAFTDSYPAGLVNTASASGATTCGAGAVTAASSCCRCKISLSMFSEFCQRRLVVLAVPESRSAVLQHHAFVLR